MVVGQGLRLGLDNRDVTQRFVTWVEELISEESREWWTVYLHTKSWGDYTDVARILDIFASQCCHRGIICKRPIKDNHTLFKTLRTV